MGAGGVFARGEDPDTRSPFVRRRGAAEPWDQARPQQRRLPAAGGSDDHDHPMGAYQTDEIADEPVPAEEPLVIPRFEAGQSFVGRYGGVVLGRLTCHFP